MEIETERDVERGWNLGERERIKGEGKRRRGRERKGEKKKK